MKNVTVKDASNVTVGTFATFPDSDGDIRKRLKDEFGPGKYVVFSRGTTINKSGKRVPRLNRYTYYVDNDVVRTQSAPKGEYAPPLNYNTEKALDILKDLQTKIDVLCDDIGEIKAEVFAPEIDDDDNQNDTPPAPQSGIEPQDEIAAAFGRIMTKPENLQFISGLLTKTDPNELANHFSETVKNNPQILSGIMAEVLPAFQPAIAKAMSGLMG